ncbi:MAG: discoidin domain-containing protein, partial [Planctomycetaceae bacterium]|nr:discoidin domain-containing protein [Planctomycetaceae bacterium]
TASHGGNKVSLAVDGNAGTRWDTAATQRPGMWFQITMPDPAQVLALTLDTRGSRDDYPRRYYVQTSLDGKTWGEKVAEGIGINPVTEIELNSPSPVSHIRITQTGSSSSKYWSIHELTIKGLTGKEPRIQALAEQLAAIDAAGLAREVRAKGDSRRGAAIFYNRSLSCVKCHDPQSGDRLGPDLAAKRDGVTDPFLIESILHPS